jgi:glyoxylase-like metal-dependent hydrolase (beta-lactamase superfamily II)
MRDGGAISIGAARVTPLNAGDLVLTLKDELNVPESSWRAAGYAEVFEQRQLCPSQSVLIEADGELTLVDIGDYAATVPADSPWLPRGYTPPPGIAEQIEALGFALGDVRRVVITHAHWDHFAGTTRREGGEYVPTFANAAYVLGRADWESAETQAAIGDLESLEGRTLGVLHRAGALTLVDGDRALSESVRVVGAPGESPGHQLVRVASAGAVLYCVGDLFHAPVEVEHPGWMATWAEPAAMRTSRERLIEAALGEGALLIAAHIAGVGRLEATATGARWVSA